VIASAMGLAAALVLAGGSDENAKPRVVALPGGDGGIGFDDVRFSPSLGKLLIPAGRTGNLDLVDPKTGEVVPIPGFGKQEAFGGGHGDGTTSVDEGAGFLFAIDRTTIEVAVVDPAAKAIVSRSKLAGDPDYVRFVAATREVWVTEPDAEQIEVFRLSDAKPPKLESFAKIAVPGGPESLVVDATRGRAYTHLWEGKTVAIDLKSRAIAARWANGCDGSRGIALDEKRGFLIVACAEGKATVLDVAHDGKALSTLTSGNGVDIVDYDPERGHVYFPGATSATTAILGVSAKGELTLLGTVPTARGAHGVVCDRNGHAFVADSGKGALLAFDDPYPPSAK
jgi:hypothetical protein